ncbi:RluA family pseudouridine synthase [Bacillota bacterium Lsc_1132]
MLQTNRKGNWFEITIPKKWENLTVENLFLDVWNCPKKITHLFRMGQKVLLNGKPANWRHPFEKGAKLSLELFSEEKSDVPSAYLEVPVLYEDDHLIIFNKPPFMTTHPNDMALETNTLLNAAVFHMQANGETGAIRHIHRLDRDTSGAILFVKHSFAGSLLDQMLKQRKIKRTYVAIVHGIMAAQNGIISEPIGRDRHHATRRRISPTGQEAITHYQVIKEDPTHQLTYVKCWLETGRTHQIRVHFSSLGHPLAGDLLYGGKAIFPRQALHAAKLEFTHPLTEEQIVSHAPFIDSPPIFKGIDIRAL